MAQSLTRIYVHLIYHVKTTSVCIQPDHLPDLHSYTAGTIAKLDSNALMVGGINDHIHILCTLPRKILLADFIQKIKVASHHYLTTVDAQYYKHFSWQAGYAALSVSPSIIEKTKQYIQNQPEHHRRLTFREEYLRFIQEYQVEEADERYMFTD